MFYDVFFSTRDILFALVGSEINTVAFHDAIMMLQFFQLTLCHFAVIYSLGDSRRPANQWSENAQQ